MHRIYPWRFVELWVSFLLENMQTSVVGYVTTAFTSLGSCHTWASLNACSVAPIFNQDSSHDCNLQAVRTRACGIQDTLFKAQRAKRERFNHLGKWHLILIRFASGFRSTSRPSAITFVLCHILLARSTTPRADNKTQWVFHNGGRRG